jgi:hypothetical protein
VLLDEADIFLEKRIVADLQRNALVSTFLRALDVARSRQVYIKWWWKHCLLLSILPG